VHVPCLFHVKGGTNKEHALRPVGLAHGTHDLMGLITGQFICPFETFEIGFFEEVFPSTTNAAFKTEYLPFETPAY